jgi:hypothetical protein
MQVGTFSDDMMTTRMSLSSLYPVIPGTTAFLLLLAFGAGDGATDARAAEAVAIAETDGTNAVTIGPRVRCRAVRSLREHCRRLRARLGSVAVARSWWSAAVGRLPRGGTAAGPQDHRRSHARENRRRR